MLASSGVLAGPATAAMEPTHLLWCWKYENKALRGKYREGLLWWDSSLHQVKYQSISDITCWHGSLRHDPATDTMEVRFDCHAGCRSDVYDPEGGTAKYVTLKTTRVQKSSRDGVYHGCDYRGRFIEMTVVSVWTASREGRSWDLLSTFDPDLKDWVLPEFITPATAAAASSASLPHPEFIPPATAAAASSASLPPAAATAAAANSSCAATPL